MNTEKQTGLTPEEEQALKMYPVIIVKIYNNNVDMNIGNRDAFLLGCEYSDQQTTHLIKERDELKAKCETYEKVLLLWETASDQCDLPDEMPDYEFVLAMKANQQALENYNK